MAFTTATLTEITNNFLQLFGEFEIFITSGAFVLGFVMVGSGWWLLAKSGSSPNVKKSGAFWLILSGILLVYGVTLLGVFGQTIYGPSFSGTPETFTPANDAEKIIQVVIVFVQMVGIYHFLSGWRMMGLIGDGTLSKAAKGKAVWKILGGVMSVNIILTSQLIAGLFGLEVL